MKIEAEECDETVVTLDTYNSDLNLVIDSARFSAKPLTSEGFAFMWAGARATHGASKGRFCFELKVLDHLNVSHLPADEPNPHVVRIGFSVESSTMQLGEDPLSYGYGGTGKISTNCQFKDFGGPFTAGDVIMGAVNADSEMIQIGFAKNGKFLGWAYRISRSELKGQALFPHILTKNVSFEVNLGQKDKPYFPFPDALVGFSFIGCLPLQQRESGTRAPKRREDCEMIMMCGLPGAGKSVWAAEYSKKNPKKKYNVLGTNNIIDKMKVMGLPRKRNYHGRWDVLIQMATKCLNKMFEIGSKLRRNYILDQTNVYPTAQRRKMRNFEGFVRKAVVVVPSDVEYKRRCDKRDREEGKEVPDHAVLEMKANFKLPEVCDIFNEVNYTELPREEAEKLVIQYNDEGKAAVGPPKKQFKSSDGTGSRFDSGRENRGSPVHGGFSPRGDFDGRNRGGFEGGRGGFGGGRGGFEGGRGGRGGFEGGRGGRGGFEGGRGGRGGFEGGRGGFEGGRGGFEGGRQDFDRNRGFFHRNRGGFEGGRGEFNRVGGFEEDFDNRLGFEGNRGGFKGGREGFDSNRGGWNRSSRGGFDGDREGYARNQGGFDRNRGGLDRSRGGGRFDNGQGNHEADYGNNDASYGARGGFNNNRGTYDNGRGGFDRKRKFDDGARNSPGGYGESTYSENSGNNFRSGGRDDYGRGARQQSDQDSYSGRGGRQPSDQDSYGGRGARQQSDQDSYGGRGGRQPSDQDSYSGRGGRQQSDQDSYGGRDLNFGGQRGGYRGGSRGGGNSRGGGYSSGNFNQDSTAGSYGGGYGDKPSGGGYQSEYSSGSYGAGSQRSFKKEPGSEVGGYGAGDSARNTRASGRASRWSAAEAPETPSSYQASPAQEKTSYSSYTPQVKTEPADNAGVYGYSSYTPQVKAEPADNSAAYGYDSYSTNAQSYTSYVPPSQPTQGYQTTQQAYGYQTTVPSSNQPAPQAWDQQQQTAAATPAATTTQDQQQQWAQYYQQQSQYYQYYGQQAQQAGSTPAYGAGYGAK